MHLFKYRAGELYAEDVPVRELAEKYGTPLYIYSYNTLLRHFKAYDEAFNDYPHIICFAVKSNPNTAILRLFAKQRRRRRHCFGRGTVCRIEGGHTIPKDSLCGSRKDRG